jgi:hypothetical protein
LIAEMSYESSPADVETRLFVRHKDAETFQQITQNFSSKKSARTSGKFSEARKDLKVARHLLT